MAFECPGEGWVKGRNTKGRTAWNKGVPQTEEHRRKNSETHKGKTPWNKGKRDYKRLGIKEKRCLKSFVKIVRIYHKIKILGMFLTQRLEKNSIIGKFLKGT